MSLTGGNNKGKRRLVGQESDGTQFKVFYCERENKLYEGRWVLFGEIQGKPVSGCRRYKNNDKEKRKR